MNQQYHLCLLTQNTSGSYGLIFKEIAALLIYSFAVLGRSCSFKVNQLDPERINIIIGSYFLAELPALLQTKYIVYQLEQLSDEPEGWYQQFPEVIQNILENSLEIWDYSTENLKFLQKKDLPAKLLPVGYLEKLETISPTKKDIDVLFYGSLNERRRRILTALSDRGLKVQHLFAVYGTQRDAYIARSKIILNIHFYEARIFEAARIAYLLNNQAFVITEESVDNPYPAVELIQVPYAQLIEECVQRVADYENSQKIAQKNYQQFKANYAMPGLLASVLS